MGTLTGNNMLKLKYQNYIYSDSLFITVMLRYESFKIAWFPVMFTLTCKLSYAMERRHKTIEIWIFRSIPWKDILTKKTTQKSVNLKLCLLCNAKNYNILATL